MKVQNYYKLLKIEVSSNLDDIKKAFRNEIAIYHPDINTSKDAEKQFDKLVEAFDILSNPDKRKLYDNLLIDKNTPKIKTTVIDPKKQKAFEEWKKEAKTKSKEYKKKNKDNSLEFDLFSEAIVEGLLNGAGSLIEGAVDIIGDIISDL